jgi:hypothetical protein
MFMAGISFALFPTLVALMCRYGEEVERLLGARESFRWGLFFGMHSMVDSTRQHINGRRYLI